MSFEYYFIVLVTIIFSLLAESIYKEKNIYTHISTEIVYYPNKKLVILIASILIFFSGFRYYVGTDYGGYYKGFYGSWDVVLDKIIDFDEPGIFILSNIGRLIYDDGISSIFICSLVTISLFVITIYKYSPIFTLSILLFILNGELTGTFNGVRQYLSSAILFYGFHYILEKKFINYCIIVFIASLFHTTALVMIVPYFLFNRKIDIRQFILLILYDIIVRNIYSFAIDVVSYYKGTEIVINSYITNNVNILRILVACAPFPVYMIFRKKMSLTYKENFYLNALFFHGFSMISTGGSTYLARMGIYSSPLTVIGYCYLLKMIRNTILHCTFAISGMKLPQAEV